MSTSTNSFAEFLLAFGQTIDDASSRLKSLSAGKQSKDGSWNNHEILGHLIDSAANNHQRFVRAQFTSDLVFPGYQQDDWVTAQNYSAESWENLVQLWASYNRHLLHLLSQISNEALTRSRVEHNLNLIAFKLVPASESTTLEYFIRDYVDHLNHHLDQIFDGLVS